jgi:hypothetical protein
LVYIFPASQSGFTEPLPCAAPLALTFHLSAGRQGLDCGSSTVVGEAGRGEDGFFAVPAGVGLQAGEDRRGSVWWGGRRLELMTRAWFH